MSGTAFFVGCILLIACLAYVLTLVGVLSGQGEIKAALAQDERKSWLPSAILITSLVFFGVIVLGGVASVATGIKVPGCYAGRTNVFSTTTQIMGVIDYIAVTIGFAPAWIFIGRMQDLARLTGNRRWDVAWVVLAALMLLLVWVYGSMPGVCPG